MLSSRLSNILLSLSPPMSMPFVVVFLWKRKQTAGQWCIKELGGLRKAIAAAADWWVKSEKPSKHWSEPSPNVINYYVIILLFREAIIAMQTFTYSCPCCSPSHRNFQKFSLNRRHFPCWFSTMFSAPKIPSLLSIVAFASGDYHLHLISLQRNLHV